MFFPGGQFTLDLTLAVILASLSGLFVFSKPFRTWATGEDSTRIGDIAMLGLVFLYVIALFYAASMDLAMEGALNYFALLLPYFAFRMNPVRRLIGGWSGGGFAIASVVVDVIGIANGWGQLKYPSATESTSQGQIEIASVFQYHNAFGVFAASLAIGILVWSARSRLAWWIRGIGLSIAGLNIASILASESRGVLAIWGVLMILAAIGMRDAACGSKDSRNRFLGDSYISAIGGLAGYELIHHAITSHHATSGWAGMVLAVVLPFVIAAVRRYTSSFLEKINARNGLWVLIGIGILGAIVGSAVKHQAIAQKIASYTSKQLSVSQRFIFWGDGLHIFSRNPVTGSGAGAWQAMYMRVQSYPYYSNKSHSFGIDTLIEVGILGAVCMIGLIWPMLRQVVWPSRKQLENPQPLRFAFVAAGFMLFCHSLMDWDMSFEYLLMLFFMGAGAAASEGGIVRWSWIRNGFSRRFMPSVIGIFSIATALVSVGGLIANEVTRNASQQSPSTAEKSFRTAYHFAPYDGNYLANAALALLHSSTSTESQQQAEDWIRSAERLDPYSSSIAADYAQIAYQLGNYSLAFEQAQLAAKNAPYWPTNMSLALTAGTVYGLQIAPHNPAAAHKAFMSVIELYQASQAYQVNVSKLPSYLPPAVPYTLDGFSVVSVAASEYVLGFTAAGSLAATEEDSTDQHTKDTATLIAMMSSDSPGVAAFVKSHSDVQSSYHLVVAARKALGTLSLIHI